MKPEVEFVNHSALKSVKVFVVQVFERQFHMHMDYEMGYVLKGSIQVTTNSETYLLEEGDVYFLNANQVHGIKSITKDNYVLCVQIPSRYLKNILPDLGKLKMTYVKVKPFFDEQASIFLKGELLEMAKSYLNAFKYYELEVLAKANGLLFELLKHVPHEMLTQQVYTQEREKTRRMTNVLEYIQNNYQKEISLGEIAERENVTRTHMSHFIKENLGIGFQAYIGKLRLEHARYLIRHTSLPLIDIYMDAGYSSHKYLKKAFLEAYGLKPNDYRKALPESISDVNINVFNNTQRLLTRENSLKYLNAYKLH